MTEKRNVTFYLEEYVADYVQQEHINASGLTNALIKMYMRGEVDL
jgi:hypothetical protein